MRVQISSLRQLFFTDGFIPRRNQHPDLSLLRHHYSLLGFGVPASEQETLANIVMQEEKIRAPQNRAQARPSTVQCEHVQSRGKDKLVGISVTSSKDGVVCSLSEPFLLDSDCHEWD